MSGSMRARKSWKLVQSGISWWASRVRFSSDQTASSDIDPTNLHRKTGQRGKGEGERNGRREHWRAELTT